MFDLPIAFGAELIDGGDHARTGLLAIVVPENPTAHFDFGLDADQLGQCILVGVAGVDVNHAERPLVEQAHDIGCSGPDNLDHAVPAEPGQHFEVQFVPVLDPIAVGEIDIVPRVDEPHHSGPADVDDICGVVTGVYADLGDAAAGVDLPV